MLPQNCRELPRLSGVTANCRELPQTIVGSYRKKSRELPQKSRELPQEKSGVTAKNVGNEKKSRELPQEKSGVTARKVGSYRKKSRELPQTHVGSYRKHFRNVFPGVIVTSEKKNYIFEISRQNSIRCQKLL